MSGGNGMRGGNGVIVDVHAHAIIGEVEALVTGHPGLAAQRALDARRNGPASAAVSRQMVMDRMPQLSGVDRRLADMQAAGVDSQVISPSPSQYHYYAELELARLVCRTAGAGIAAIVAEEPDRFTGLGLVPLQHPQVCVDALDEALAMGLIGVELSSHAPRPEGAGDGGATIELSDPALDAFWARAAETGALLFLHPFGCTLDERLDRYYLANTIGQPVENAVALSHLVFSGVLDRHPGLRVLASHGGGYLPTYLGRSDHAWQVRPEAHDCAAAPSTYLRRLMFDSLVHSRTALRALVDAVGESQIVLGSDYPFDMGVSDPVDRVRAAGLSAEATEAILSGNAARLELLPTHPTGAST